MLFRSTMFTLKNSVRPRIEITNNEKLQNLLLQAKITPVNKIVAERELKDTLTKNTTLYNYDLSKFYSYHTKILFKTVMDGSDNRFNFIYSNIEFKVH